MTDEGDLVQTGNIGKLLLMAIETKLQNEMPDIRSMQAPVKFTLRLIFPNA